MISPARALLLSLLPSLGVAACSEESSTPPASTTVPGGASGTGGTGGSTGGSGGGSVGGSAGASGAAAGSAGSSGAPVCQSGRTKSGDGTICFGPDGKSDTIARSQFEGGDFQVECANFQRAPGSACPADLAPCGYGSCGTYGTPYGSPTLVEDRCCFSLLICTAPSACGRPLFVDAVALVARLVSSSSWV